MTAATIISIALGFTLRYEIIANIPSKHVKYPVKGAGIIDEKYMSDNLCYKGVPIETLDIDGIYNITLETEGGSLGFENYRGTAEELKQALAETKVCPDYVGIEINLKIDFYKSRTLRFLDEFSHNETDYENQDSENRNNSEDYDDTLDHNNTIGDNTTDYKGPQFTLKIKISFDTEIYTRISGCLKSNNGAIIDADVIPVFGLSQEIESKTDSDGLFNISVPISPNNRAYKATALISKLGYIPTNLTFTIGGFPLYTTALPSVFIPESSSKVGTIQGTILNLHSNSTLDGVHLDIRQGFNNLSGSLLDIEPYIQDGNFTYANIDPGVYTITAYKENYMSDIRIVTVNGGQVTKTCILVSPNNMSPDMFRIILGWEGIYDMDFHAIFKVDNKTTCHVDFTNPRCGGAILRSQEILDGGETGESLTFREVSPASYLVYVKMSENHNEMSQSLATIDILISQYPQSIAKLGIPNQSGNIWLAFCINGSKGLESLYPLEKVIFEDELDEHLDICKTLFQNDTEDDNQN